jgi:hypothetical protein
MKSNIGYIILCIFLGYVLFELLKVVFAYPIGVLSGALNWEHDSAMLVDSTLSAIIAGGVAVILIRSRLRKSGDGKGEKS